jgi:hypothetical protein
MFTYLQGNKKLTPRQAMMFPVIAAGQDLTGEPEVIRVFESNADFSKWADRTPHGERVQEILRIVRDKVLPEQGNAVWVEQVQRLAFQHAEGNFRDFAKLLGRSPIDEEVIRLAMVDRTPLTPKVFDPALLYDQTIEREPPMGAPENSQTNMLPVWSGFWPDLGWAGWNDRARSGRIFGLNILCQNTWFGGRWAWLMGFNMLLNLRHLGFDRITSSVIAF